VSTSGGISFDSCETVFTVSMEDVVRTWAADAVLLPSVSVAMSSNAKKENGHVRVIIFGVLCLLGCTDEIIRCLSDCWIV